MLMCIYLFSCWDLAGPYVILFAVGALHDHVANNDIRDAQHAIEFCNLGGISVEIDEGVDTVGQTIDLVSEFTLAPLVNVVDGTLSGRDNARVSSSVDGAIINSSS